MSHPRDSFLLDAAQLDGRDLHQGPGCRFLRAQENLDLIKTFCLLSVRSVEHIIVVKKLNRVARPADAVHRRILDGEVAPLDQSL